MTLVKSCAYQGFMAQKDKIKINLLILELHTSRIKVLCRVAEFKEIFD